MSKHTTGPDPAPGSQVHCLAELHLSAQEQAALCRQGFVSREKRGRGTVFKLRLRVAGRQKVRFLGRDPRRARAIAREVRQAQARHRLDQLLRRLTAEARSLLRQIKVRLTPLLAERGLRFHGRAVRRPRREKTPHLASESRHAVLGFFPDPPFMEDRRMSVPPADRPDRPVPPTPPRRPSPRLKRIRDYEAKALSDADLLKANLGAINADMMRNVHRLFKMTHKAMARSCQPLEDFPALLPALNVATQLARQIERYAELDGKLPAGDSRQTATGSSQP